MTMNQLLHHYLRTRDFPTPPKPAKNITTTHHAKGEQIHYAYGPNNRPLHKSITRDGETTTITRHYDENGHPTRLTIHHEDQLIKELTIQTTPTEIRETGEDHHTVITYDPEQHRLTEINTYTSNDIPPITTIDNHDFKPDNSRVITTTDLEGRTPASFETYDPNSINTGRISRDLHTHTHIYEHDQHGFPTKATHLIKNELRTTTHDITWQIDYHQ